MNTQVGGIGSAPRRALRFNLETDASRFMVAGLVAAGFFVFFVLWVGPQVGGEESAGVVEDIAPALMALIAGATLLVTARKSLGQRRLAWSLIGASAIAWGVGAVVTAAFELELGKPPPVPSAADVLLLAYPLAIAGVMVVPTAPSRLSTRGRAIIDAGIIASALVFMSWAFGLGAIYRSSSLTSASLWITHARPFADIVVLTVLIPATLKAAPRRRGRLLLLLAGFAAISFSDFAYTILTTSGAYAGSSDLLDTGWVTGYLLIALAPLFPLRASNESLEDQPSSLLEVAVPFLALATVALTTLAVTGTGHKIDPFIAFPGAALGILLTASQLMTHRDSLVLLAESKRKEAQLREQSALLNQVVGHTPAGLARVSREERVVDANPRLCALLRAPTRVIVGSSLADYLPATDVDMVFQGIPAVSNDVETVEVDSEAVRADQSKLWLHWSITPVRNQLGGIEYFLGMFEDVTSDHEADAVAMANLASLEKLSKLKSEFVTMVSHEFRTALTGIQGYSEVMRDDTVTAEEVKEFAGDINSDAVRLSKMITEMLDLDRMEAGRMKLNLGRVDINSLLSDAAARARVSSSKHRITVVLGSGVPTMVGDSDRLFQVITNLMTNAIKYSPSGGEIVLSSGVDGGSVKVGVRDHGPGIPAEFIDRLFGRYERYEGNAKSQVIGTGLGLAIARQIVEMHRGRIWVESKLGEGSEFLFTIPIEAGLQAVAPPARDATA